MFRENTGTNQPSFFDSQQLMSEKMQKRLKTSWAQVFREDVYQRIPESHFEILYSDKYSRPNAAVNVLVGCEILKSGFNWSDEELADHMTFDLQCRYALGLDDLAEEAPTLRTIYNFRRRVREHAEKEGDNLYHDVFTFVTDDQIDNLALKTEWQRMDSTQILSNIAWLNRLELVVSVLQKGIAALPKESRREWETKASDYSGRSAQTICYRLKQSDTTNHLLQVGNLLAELLPELQAVAEQQTVAALVERVLTEQYNVQEKQVDLKAGQEISASSLQSPHDPDATYREKAGKRYKGYVINLSETCDPDNPLQLVTDIQTAPNTTDDGQLLSDALDGFAERALPINEITVDGGYNGSTALAACQEHEATLRPSTIRGGKASEKWFQWNEYQWQLADDGEPEQVTCPAGQTAELQNGGKKEWRLARFDADICQNCPFFKNRCRVKPYKKKPPTLHVRKNTIDVALMRQGMSSDNYKIRANVEATVHQLKHLFPAGKLPVRGLIRAQMVTYAATLMVNLRRIHAFRQKKASDQGANQLNSLETGSISLFWHLVLTQLSEHRQKRQSAFQTIFVVQPSVL